MNTSLKVANPTKLASPLTSMDVVPIPTKPTSRLNLGTEVPIPTLDKSVSYRIPGELVHPNREVLRPVRPDPSPTNLVAVTTPAIFVLPTTCSLK